MASELRDAIARAIAVAQDADGFYDEIEAWENSEAWEQEAYPDECPAMAYEDRENYRAAAATVLAVLADLPESVVEAAARRVDPAAWDDALWQCGGLRGVIPDSEGATAAREEARGIAQTVLAALAGGEVDVSAS